MAYTRPGSYSGQSMKMVVVQQVTDGIAHCLDDLGRNLAVPVTPRSGLMPRQGDTWILDRHVGRWAFSHVVTSEPTVVTDLSSLADSLASLGLITNSIAGGGSVGPLIGIESFVASSTVAPGFDSIPTPVGMDLAITMPTLTATQRLLVTFNYYSFDWSSSGSQPQTAFIGLNANGTSVPGGASWYVTSQIADVGARTLQWWLTNTQVTAGTATTLSVCAASNIASSSGTSIIWSLHGSTDHPAVLSAQVV